MRTLRPQGIAFDKATIVPHADMHQMSGNRGPRLPSVRLTAHLMLADYAVVGEGKLYLSGGGWTRAHNTAAVMAIGGVLIKPWQQLETSTELSLRLVRGDGATVLRDACRTTAF